MKKTGKYLFTDYTSESSTLAKHIFCVACESIAMRKVLTPMLVLNSIEVQGAILGT